MVDDDTIIRNYLKVLEFGEKHSGCSKAHLGAGLFSKDDSYEPILGANGVVRENCRKKDSCTRVRDEGLQTEFRSCPSACGEAAVLFNMYHISPEELENIYMISVRPPCERCTALMIMYGEKEIMTELYFGEYRNGEPRDTDNFNVDVVIASGIKVHQIKFVDGAYKIFDVEQKHDLNDPYYKKLGLKLPNPVPYGHIRRNNLPLSRKLYSKKRKEIFGKTYM
ncbi:MAG: hypothetical protein ABIF85_03095 [Nanoarchaeota archaeon]